MTVREEIIFARAIKALEAAYLPFSAETITEIKRYWKISYVRKGKIITRKSWNEKKYWFIVEGGLRIFYLKKLKQVSLRFIFENCFVSNFNDLHDDSNSSSSVEALENSILMELDNEAIDHLGKRWREIEILQKFIANESVKSYQNHLILILFESAEERYETLLRTSPDVVCRLTLGHIASYIGISLETLSRIRRKKAIQGKIIRE